MEIKSIFKGWRKSDAAHVYHGRQQDFDQKGKLTRTDIYYFVPALVVNREEQKGAVIPVGGIEGPPDDAIRAFDQLMFLQRRKPDLPLAIEYPVEIQPVKDTVTIPTKTGRTELAYSFVKKGEKIEPGFLDWLLGLLGL